MSSPRDGGAVVTGAGSGLGREIALRLGRLGWHVHATDMDEALAGSVAAEIRDAGGSASSSAVDVRDPDACRTAARATAAQSGALGLWVNNAGVLTTGPVWSHSDQQRRLMMEVNALGTMHGTIAALEVMRPAHRGHVVNIASLAGLVSVPGEGVYAASKHAVMGFSTSALCDLRVEGERAIDISCVCPDGMWTPMLFDKVHDPDAAMSFSGRLFQPEEIAELVLRVVAKPRPVTTAPVWRGVQVRLFDLVPGLAVRVAPYVVRLAHRQQAAMARKMAP
ncbi:SDR family NAD(P)-dependent oxidoreductase [Arthrobacter echini]|uniref:SDR family NAD(P)-dependent oxidoreductase n=1 Tax=Arthrobacter echini TaxID=1529066 RepID=A0A4S5E7M1_9MICC|nr:SDR family NAD(P)-dependent oxidoreductase [Arthrobacter echini]THJ67480.1 SDR family NAD(P)-dependent oxidoreductase [Arthrobacter echini]